MAAPCKWVVTPISLQQPCQKGTLNGSLDYPDSCWERQVQEGKGERVALLTKLEKEDTFVARLGSLRRKPHIASRKPMLPLV
jgi:hypothetical protein